MAADNNETLSRKIINKYVITHVTIMSSVGDNRRLAILPDKTANVT